MIKTPTTLTEYFALADTFNETLADFHEVEVTGGITSTYNTKLIEIERAMASMSALLVAQLNNFQDF